MVQPVVPLQQRCCLPFCCKEVLAGVAKAGTFTRVMIVFGSAYFFARVGFFCCFSGVAFHIGVYDCATLRWYLQAYLCLWVENGSPSSSTGPSVL